ncbi:MAG: hypothetical protein JWO13_1963 [Acidobacteriales bacterium]|nr:hypothetical protein [Terriglobales bacterium]
MAALGVVSVVVVVVVLVEGAVAGAVDWSGVVAVGLLPVVLVEDDALLEGVVAVWSGFVPVVLVTGGVALALLVVSIELLVLGAVVVEVELAELDG